MLFTSYEFIGFAALVLLGYYLVPGKVRWIWLLAAGLAFYALANPIYVIFIVATSLAVWLISREIGSLEAASRLFLREKKDTLSADERKQYKAGVSKDKKTLLIFALIFSLGILAVVKYTNFMIANINAIAGAWGRADKISFVNIIVPLGLSFYTFKAVGYIVDVYRGTIEPERNFFKFLLFVSFFPEIVQGPISRYGELSKTLFEGHSYDAGKFNRGLYRVLWGFFKKLVVADRILPAVNTIIHDVDAYHGVYVLLGMAFYAIELYADFTGGIDITIGLSEAMGIDVTENFVRPFFSKSVREYWRRWHISMGTWFRDYVFYPLSVSRFSLKLSKFSRNWLGNNAGKRIPVYLSSLIVWFLTGIWHGASWTFVMWGIGNFVIIMISEELDPLFSKLNRLNQAFFSSRFMDAFRVLRTVFLMSLLRTFDCYNSVSETFAAWGSIFTDFGLRRLTFQNILSLGISLYDLVIVAISVIVMFAVSMLGRSGSVRDKINGAGFGVKLSVYGFLLFAIILFGAYGQGYDAGQFIYNQF